MALTNLTAINKVLSRLAESGAPAAYPADVLPLIATALDRFAVIVAKSEDRELLRKDFSVTITSGTGSLAASLAAAEPLLAEFLSSAYVVSSAGVQFHYLPDRTQLNLTRPSMILYWTNDLGTIRTRNTDGSLTSLSTTLTITGQYSPIITTVPVQIEEVFIDVLEGMVKSRVAVPAEAASA